MRHEISTEMFLVKINKAYIVCAKYYKYLLWFLTDIFIFIKV